MRQLLAWAAAMTALVALAGPAAAQQADSSPPAASQKVAYLDSRKVLAAAPGAADARAQIETEMQRYQNKVQVLNDSLNKVMEDYQRQSVLLSPEAKKTKEADLVKLRTSLSQQAQSLADEAQQRQNELMQPVMDRVNKVIAQIREEGGYAIIFDVASSAMLSADSTLDLTDRVIAKLKAGTPTAANKTP